MIIEKNKRGGFSIIGKVEKFNEIVTNQNEKNVSYEQQEVENQEALNNF